MQFFNVFRPTVTYVSFSQQPWGFESWEFVLSSEMHGSSTYLKHNLLHLRDSCNKSIKVYDNKWYKRNGFQNEKMIHLAKKEFWVKI